MNDEQAANYGDLDIQGYSYNQQLELKKNYLMSMLSQFSVSSLDVFNSPANFYRMRSEFRIWHDGDSSSHIMFDPKNKEKINVQTFPLACKLINQAMKITIDTVTENSTLRTKLFQIDYLATTSNELIVTLIYHRTLDDEWLNYANLLQQQLSDHLPTLSQCNIIGRAKKQKLIIGNDYINEKLTILGKQYSFRQIENSFTQPNAHINVKMIEWVATHCNDKNADLLELYCGAGNFSVPLADYFNRVFATEISKSSVSAAQINIQENKVNNLTIARLSSEEFVSAYNDERSFNRLKNIDLKDYDFKTILVDPPRAGLDDATLELIAQFDSIIYISCNPMTLVENLKVLSSTHAIKRAALFDQFPQTLHIESGVVLSKIKR